MKILFMCLVFCNLSIQGMSRREEKAFLDTLSPENILGGAMRELFPASDSERELATLENVLHALTNQRAANSKLMIQTPRSIISLNQAIMLGKLKAFEDGIEYEDFEQKLEPQGLFIASFQDLNSHIYTCATPIEEADYAQVIAYQELKNKIQNDTTALTDDELLTFQKPVFLAFLGYIDISMRRQQVIDVIRNDDNLSQIQQNEKIALIEHHALQITRHRAHYFAALASRNPEAISFHSAQPLHLQAPKTLLQQIQELRAEGVTTTTSKES